jgi:hypothetical protein
LFSIFKCSASARESSPWLGAKRKYLFIQVLRRAFGVKLILS